MKNKKMQRRDFLKTAGLGAFGFAASTFLPGTSLLGGAFGSIEAYGETTEHTLIYVMMRGGADALSLFPPLRNNPLGREYIAARPDINFSSADNERVEPLRDLNGDVLPFGVHSSMPEIKRLWNEGKLSVIHGFGAVSNNTSHFNQFAHIECGSSRVRRGAGIFQKLKTQAGWAGDFDLVALEPIVPASLTGTNFVLQYSTPQELTKLAGSKAIPGLTKAERLEGNYGSIGRVRLIAEKLHDISIADAAELSAVATDGAIKIQSLQEVARIMQFKKRPKVITVSLLGWDFHSSLTSNILDSDLAAPNNIKALSTSLGALVDSLGDKLRTTTIVVMSEFGRRMVQNGALGADHGRGGVAFLIGHPDRIVGRKMLHRADFVKRMVAVYQSNRADKKQLQIPVDYDYRMLLGAIFQKRFGLSPEQIRGSEEAVFLENYVDGRATVSEADTLLPEMSGLFPEYRLTTVQRAQEISALLKA